jgi:hypothetical protein
MKQNNQTIKDKDMNKENTTTTIVKTIHELSLRVKAIRELPLRIVRNGMLFAIGFFGTTILAVAISGTIKTWTTGEVLKSADLNTTIASLQTAIQNIPNWTKAANGNDAYYTAGNVGIGLSNPSSNLHILNDNAKINLQRASNGRTGYLSIANANGGMRYHGGNNGSGELPTIAHMFTGDSPTADNTYMVITGGGSVGIGTAAPSYLLTINSNANTTAPVIGLTKPTGGGATNWSIRGGEDGLDNGTFIIRDDTVGPRFAIKSNGNVGISTTSPSQMLTVNGNAGNTTGVWVNNSDERLKKNIQPLGNFLEKLTELRPVTFEWKDPKKLNAKEGKHIGFIAQEVEKVFPYWVDTDKDGMKWLSMEGVNAAFVQSFKEVALRLRSTSERVSFVTDSVSVVTQKIDSLEKEKAANEKKLLALEEDNKRLREMVETHGRASLRLEDRLRAIENMQMARK